MASESYLVKRIIRPSSHKDTKKMMRVRRVKQREGAMEGQGNMNKKEVRRQKEAKEKGERYGRKDTEIER